MLTANTKAPKLFALAAALLVPFAGAMAQSALPDDLVRKNEIGESDKQVIKAFVDANKSGLTGTATDVKKSRETLLAPLEKSGITVPFRVAYANALIESAHIDTLAASKDNDLTAANALRLAGQAATASTMKIVSDSLKDSRPQVRCAATVAARAAFTAARTTPALSAEQLAAALRALGDVVATDPSKEVVDGAVQAMIAAREIPGTRSLAIERLTDAAGLKALAIAKSPDGQDLAPLLRVAAAIRADMTDSGSLTPEARKGAAAFSGQLLIAIGGVWKEGTPPDTAIAGAKAAEAILTLADQAAGKNRTFTIAATVSGARKEQFGRELNTIVGAGSVLQSEPYSIAPARLKP